MEEFKTAYEWSKYYDIEIMDPDGWRPNSNLGEKSLEEKIGREEFIRRAALSTLKQQNIQDGYYLYQDKNIDEHELILVASTENGITAFFKHSTSDINQVQGRLWGPIPKPEELREVLFTGEFLCM